MKKQFFWQKWFIIAFLIFGTVACGGSKKTEEKTETPNSNTTNGTKTDEVEQPKPADKEQVVEGGALNTYFPKPQGDFDIVFTQEKDGFVQAVLKEKNEQVATFSVADMANNPDGAKKYATAKEKLDMYPMSSRGKADMILVGEKYQVSVQSDSEAFTKEMRQTWLKRFNLSGLATLKK